MTPLTRTALAVIAVAALVAPAAVASASAGVPAASAAGAPVFFADPQLESCVRSEMARMAADDPGFAAPAAGQPVTDAALAAVTELSCDRVAGLAGIEGATSLGSLDLVDLQTADLRPLAGVPSLFSLTVQGGPVTDLTPLASLPALESLGVWNAPLSDLAPLAGLTTLHTLGLSDTAVSDLRPLAGLTGLTTLDITGSATLSDVSALASLTSLEVLYLRENPLLRSVSALAPLTGLVHLDLHDNDLESLDGVQSMSRLEFLQASWNRLTAIDELRDAAALRQAYLDGNLIVDVSPLSGKDALEALQLHDNLIEDVTPITGLPRLTSLELSFNRVTDLSAFAGNRVVGTVSATGQRIGVDAAAVGESLTLPVFRAQDGTVLTPFLDDAASDATAAFGGSAQTGMTVTWTGAGRSIIRWDDATGYFGGYHEVDAVTEGAPIATPTAPGAFVTMTPARLLDTRVGTGAPSAPVGPGETVSLRVTGRGGVPASGVAAIVVNVTATSPTSGGWVTVYPSGTSQPTASNLNFSAGQSVPNLVTVKVGANGRVNLTNNSPGSVHLLADVSGYFLSGTPQAAGAFVSLAPARLLDTRSGNGAAKASVAASGITNLQVTGRGGVPASGVSAVVLNVTATNTTAAGWITAYPTGSAQPTASNLNFSRGQSTPNLVTVKVGAGGRVSLANNSGGTVDLLADVAGYYLSGTPTEPGTFVSLDPSRLLDTRIGAGAARSATAYGTLGIQVTGRGGVPSTGVSAVVANVTVTAPTAPGFVTVYPWGSAQPTASNLNFGAGQSTPNLVTVRLGTGGRIAAVNNSGGRADLLADVAGYYLG